MITEIVLAATLSAGQPAVTGVVDRHEMISDLRTDLSAACEQLPSGNYVVVADKSVILDRRRYEGRTLPKETSTSEPPQPKIRFFGPVFYDGTKLHASPERRNEKYIADRHASLAREGMKYGMK